MLYEYAVEPKAIASNWQTFRYLIEKFGFDRGRLISRFPKQWLREVYSATENFPDVDRKRIEEALNQAKKTKIVRSRRPYDPALGVWLDNALAQHALMPFHAIIAETKPIGQDAVLVAAEIDEHDPLMISPRTWLVPRTGPMLADAMELMLRSSRTLLFVDPYFNISKGDYKETLAACLDIVNSNATNSNATTEVRCEIHFCDRRGPPMSLIEQNASKWVRGVIPDGLSIVLHAWQEKNGGEDFHARYLLTDVGGILVEAGFSAVGDHQNVQLDLLDQDLVQTKLESFGRSSSVYDLVAPVLEITADGTVRIV